MPDEPVQRIDTDEEERPLEAGTGVCLSGGGYRAMLFHVGALWRLYEAGLLGRARAPMRSIYSARRLSRTCRMRRAS